MAKPTELEYLLMSAMSYGNFEKKDIGLFLDELVFVNIESKKRIFGDGTVWPFGGKEIFNRTFLPFLKDWKLISVQNETIKYGMNQSGLYAIAFQKGNQTVISYRGSDLSSLGSAYKDLIETDLMIGIGGKPLQLDQGVVFYKNLLNAGYKTENISITGHSLGGGIAQYVALISDKEGLGIPNVFTRNAVGIKKSGILTLVDFIDFDNLIRNKYPILLKNITVFNKIKSYYYSQLISSLKKQNYIKDKEKINMIEHSTFHLDLDISAQTKLEDILLTNKAEINKLNLLNAQPSNTNIKKQFLVSVETLFIDLFSSKKLYPELIKAKTFIDAYKKNNKYNEKIFNYIHSNDFTSSLYPHMGTTFAVDKGLKTLNEETNPFIKTTQNYTNKNLGKGINYILKKAFSLSKSIISYHMIYIFLAFFEFTGTNKGIFNTQTSLEYVASAIRKIIYKETNLSDNFLGYYYSLNIVDMTEQNYMTIKSELLHALSLSKLNIQYISGIIKLIKSLNHKAFLILRNQTRAKLSSPYRKLDIHDLIIFQDRERI